MYDSPRTKIIKSVFDDQNNFAIFKDYCLEFEKEHNVKIKVFGRQLLDFYNQFKKDLRDKFKKLAADKKINFESEDTKVFLTEIFVNGIRRYAKEFSYNRINPNQVHHVSILRQISDDMINEITNSKFIASEDEGSASGNTAIQEVSLELSR